MWRELGITITMLVLSGMAVGCLVRAWVVQIKLEEWKQEQSLLINALEREKYPFKLANGQRETVYNAGVNRGLDVAVCLVKNYLGE